MDDWWKGTRKWRTRVVGGRWQGKFDWTSLVAFLVSKIIRIYPFYYSYSCYILGALGWWPDNPDAVKSPFPQHPRTALSFCQLGDIKYSCRTYCLEESLGQHSEAGRWRDKPYWWKGFHSVLVAHGCWVEQVVGTLWCVMRCTSDWCSPGFGRPLQTTIAD